MKRYIYLDMDGVLADFDAEMIRKFGGRFDTIAPDAVSRWALITQHAPDLYADLQEMIDADALVAGVIQACVQYDYTPAILTAIPKYGRLPNAVTHKKEWIRTRWPVLHKNFNIGPHAVDKQTFAKPGHILIDDSYMNIPQWNAAGGFGILHTSANDSLEQLNKFLEGQHASISR